MSKKELNIGIVGTRFMGRAHSNAYLDVAHYFDLPLRPVMKAACDNDSVNLNAFAQQFGWQEQEADWEALVSRDDIDLIDICTPNALHMPIAVAAAKAGKHVICEKPLALDAGQAREMLDAARHASVCHMTAFNYRRVPALALAKQLIEQGRVGRVFHFNAVYYQDWLVDPAFPFVWRHDKKIGGSGAHGDMNAHLVDLARFLVGEIESVCGDEKVFIKTRTTPDGKSSGKVTADDATQFMARFSSGAMGAFVATRFASGRKNFLRVEIFGSEGSLVFNLERLNELEFYSRSDDATQQGFRNILVTENSHPYVNAWWPPGHIIGWEHTFIHEIADLITAIGTGGKVLPDFHDGYRCQQVLDAATSSAASGRWIDLPED